MGRIEELRKRQAAEQQGPRLTGSSTTPTSSSRIERLRQGASEEEKQLRDANIEEWNKKSTFEKATAAFKEVPGVLYNFIPQAIRDNRNNPDTSLPHAIAVGATGAYQFVETAARGIAEGILGAGLTGYEKVTGKKGVAVNVPLLGEIGSYGHQTEQYVNSGFTESEAKAMVGINAYLSATPFVVKGLQSKPGRVLSNKIATEEVPVAETLAGVRERILTGEAPEGNVRVTRPVIENARRIFGLTEEQKLFNDLEVQNKQAFYDAREAILSREDPLNAALLKLDNNELAMYSDLSQGHIAADAANLSAELRKAIELNRKLNEEIETDLISRGVLSKDQIENRKWIPVETVSGRSRAELAEMGVEPLYYPYLSDAKLTKSDFVAATGRRTKGGYQKRFTGKLLAEDSYIKNPKIAIPRHRVQVLKDKMSSEFVGNVIDAFAEKSKKVIKAYNENPKLAEHAGLVEWKPAGNLRFFPVKTASGKTVRGVTKKVESYWVPESVAKSLDRMFKPGFVEKALRLTYDPVIDIWRTSVLHLMPRWIYNNFIGNSILATMAGTGPISYTKALGVSMSHSPIARIFGIKPAKLPEGIRSREYAGGEGSGKTIMSDLNMTHLNRPIENWLAMLEVANRVPLLRYASMTTQGLLKAWMTIGAKTGGAINSAVENFFRTAVFLSKRDQLFLDDKLRIVKKVSDEEGVKHVNEFLNDYSKLSRVERQTFRRALPFWNWMRFITKFALELPIKHPIRAQIANVVLQDYVDYINLNQAADKEKSIFRIKTDMVDKDGKPMYINVKSAIPFADVFRTLPTSWDTLKSFLAGNPVTKLILERSLRTNTFTGQPFTAPPGPVQKDRFGNVINPLPSFTEHVLQQFPQTDIYRDVTDYMKYGEVLRRYDTGDYKLVNNRTKGSDIVQEVLKYFGITLSGIEINKMNRLEEIELRVQQKDAEIYEKRLQKELEKLEAQKGLEVSFFETPKAHAAAMEGYQQEYQTEQGSFLGRFLTALPGELVRQSLDFAKNPFDLYGSVAQSVAQLPVNVELTVANAITGNDTTITPETPLEKFLFGEKPITDFFDHGKQVLVATGETDQTVIDKWGPSLGVVMGALNFTPTGPKGLRVTTRTSVRLENTVSKANVNRQVIDDMLKQPDVNKFERAVHTKVLDDMTKETSGNVNVRDYIERVETHLLPLQTRESIRPTELRAIADEMSYDGMPNYTDAEKSIDASGKFVRQLRYESTYHLPESRRGDVVPNSYKEIIFESPHNYVSSHFPTESKNYFAHVRTDVVKEGPLLVTRDLEWQSDLFQRGRFRREFEPREGDSYRTRQESGFDQLQPYEKFWPERVAAERARAVASTGGIYRVPTGKTARTIEKHDAAESWLLLPKEFGDIRPLTPADLKVGQRIGQGSTSWTITRVLGGTKFRAGRTHGTTPSSAQELRDLDAIFGEDFDLNTEFDYDAKITDLKEAVAIYGPNDPRVKDLQGELEIYRFYEREIPDLFRRGGIDMKQVTDPNGFSWWQADLIADPNRSVGAYGFLPPVVRNAKMKGDPMAGFVSPQLLLGASAGFAGLSALVGSLGRTYEFKNENPNEAKTVPEIVDQREDKHGVYFMLEGDVSARPVQDPEVFKDLYKEYSRLPKGLLEAVYMQESSAGTLDTNRKHDEGKNGWLVGFTKPTAKDLRSKKGDERVEDVLKVMNFDTEENALRSMAAYLDYRMDVYDEEGKVARVIDDPIELYFKRYNVGSDNEKARSEFKARFNYYKSQ